jgi:hypothetical protein
VRQELPRAVGGEDAVQRFAVDVELELIGRAVADPHRPRAPVPRPGLQDLFLELRGTVDPVHDVERATRSPAALPDPVAQPATEPCRLVDETHS